MISRLIALFMSIAVLSMSATAHAQEGCIADLDGDGVVNGNDLATVLVGWGSCAGCPGDVNGNGVVNGEDLASVLVRWGGTCAPTVTGISPDAGPLAGGVMVTITGDNLLSPTAVTFGGASATVVSSTKNAVSVIAPAHVSGPAAVLVTTQGGSASAGSFAYFGAPTIASVSPNVSAAVGGTTVHIDGSGFYGVPTVRFGKAASASVTVLSSSQLRVIVPAGQVGASVSVTVTTSSGAASLANGLSYIAAVVPAWATLIEALPDPAIVTSASLRAAITATGYAWRVRDNLTQIEMTLIPSGTFSMGCSASNQYACYPEESPVHNVTLSGAFYMGTFEVTQSQWSAQMGSNPAFHQSASTEVPAAEVPRRPVEQVSWNVVQGFLAATGMRLPTEAEWEYAYRAGTTTAFHGCPAFPDGTNDDALIGEIAWWNSNSIGQPRPVGGRAPNGFGLHDMAGNVWEWVSDWYSEGYYAVSPPIDPAGPATGTYRSLRGGSWNYVLPFWLRASYRIPNGSPDNANDHVGFRVARNP
jgi:formylglycine-generating enzyme required for sulfatase activity